jgi:hypothetical protein
MIDVVSYRARIGRFNYRSQLVSCHHKVNNFEKNYMCAFYGLVLGFLLIIGCIELNPGPQNKEITMDDLWQQLLRLNSLPDDISSIKLSVEKINNMFEIVKSDVDRLKRKCELLEKENKEIVLQCDRLESHSRRSNLIFYNVEESNGENWSAIENIIRQILCNEMKINLDDLDIERAHRLGKKNRGVARPIIVKFGHYKKKMEVLRHRSSLKGCKIRIDEDFTYRIREIRNQLKEFMFEARNKGRHAVLKFDKLVIDGQFYSLEKLKELNRNDSNFSNIAPNFKIGDRVSIGLQRVSSVEGEVTVAENSYGSRAHSGEHQNRIEVVADVHVLEETAYRESETCVERQPTRSPVSPYRRPIDERQSTSGTKPGKPASILTRKSSRIMQSERRGDRRPIGVVEQSAVSGKTNAVKNDGGDKQGVRRWLEGGGLTRKKDKEQEGRGRVMSQ